MLSLKELRYFMSNEIKLAKTLKILDKNSINKKNAFTLAETLITLTIIGVIAALTIPNLISKYQKHSYVVGLKKAYSQLQNAMKMIPITQGCPAGDFDCAGWNGDPINIEGQDFEESSYNKKVYLLSKQFKVNKLCYNNSPDVLCEKIINDLFYYNPMAVFIANDGVIWGSYFGYEGVMVDINGLKPPNLLGRDQYIFNVNTYDSYLSKSTVVSPYGSKLYADIFNNQEYYWRENNYCTTENVNKNGEGGKGAYCAGRVLEEDAMNY